MKKLFFILFILISFYPNPLLKAEEQALIYLSPSSGSFLVGSTFTVSVFLNTKEEEINAVFINLEFDPKIMQISSPTVGNSFVEEWLTPPNYSNEKGLVSFQGGIPNGIKASAGLVSAITFRVVSSGEAKIKIKEDSKIILNDGKGTELPIKFIGGEYNFLIPPPEGPKVYSSTHPDQDTYYSDSSPAFYWEKEEGVTDYSWSFDQNPNGRPDGTSEGNQTEVSFPETKDGIWYFHLRQKKEEVWGKTSNVGVKIDTAPPENFSPRVETYNKILGYQTMVYFEAKDLMSGIDRYEASIINLNTPESYSSFFTQEVSPYKVPFKEAGKYNVIIRAIDKAGNIKESETHFRMISPLIHHIEGKGLQIKDFLFPWWLIFLIILTPIFLIIFIAFKKRRKNKYSESQ